MSALPDDYVNSERTRMTLEERGVTWPLGGYHIGPDLKTCRCPDCDRVFIAGKRSIRCLPCAIDYVRSTYNTWCRMHGDLSEIVAQDERRSGISDPGHWAYPTFCVAARSRLAAMQRDIEILELVVEMLEDLPS